MKHLILLLIFWFCFCIIISSVNAVSPYNEYLGGLSLRNKMKIVNINLDLVVETITGYDDLVENPEASKYTGDTRLYVFDSKKSDDQVCLMTEPNYLEIQTIKRGMLHQGCMSDLNSTVENAVTYTEETE